GTGKRAFQIATGFANVCVTLNEGSLECWGDNGVGQLGLGDTTPRSSPRPAIDLGTGKTVAQITVGHGSHPCALLNDGSLKCWGNNHGGALGLGDEENRGDQPDEMGDHLPAVDLGT